MAKEDCATCKHEDKHYTNEPCDTCVSSVRYPGWQPKATSKSKIYIAGPIRGYPRFNFDAFHDAQSQLQDDPGWIVISPAQMDCVLEGWDGYPPEDYECSPEDGITFIRRDVDILLSFKAERGDAIYMLKGWQESKGARVEHALAEYLGLRIIYALGAHSQ